MQNDARRSFRIQLPDEQQRGVFLSGKRRYPVLLLNASADGFAFLSPQTMDLAVGAVAQLQANDAWYQVQVIRTEQTEEGFLIGVERLADIQGPLESASGSGWTKGASAQPGQAASTVLVIAGVALCTLLSAYLIAGRPNLQTIKARLGQAPVPEATIPQLEDITFVEADDQLGVPQLTFAAVQTAPQPSSRDEAYITARQRLLLSEEIASRLNLSAMQRRDIARVLEGRAQVRGQVEDAWESARQNEARLLQILTPRQVSEWRKLELP